jgi:hypothetical protein
MKWLHWTATAGLVCSLSACHVVPIATAPGQPPVYAAAPAPAAVPAQATPSLAPAPSASLHVRLYPVNDRATQLGALQGVVADSHGGRGTLSLQVAGEQLQGEATRVPSNYPGVGRLFASVLGGSTAATGGAQRGVANAYGSRCMYANCEYPLSAPGTGTGACLFSNNAKYQIHFGE